MRLDALLQFEDIAGETMHLRQRFRADIVNTGHPTGVVYAIDLSLLVPSLLLGALLLWKKRPWGYVLSSALMIKTTTDAPALIAMSPFAARAALC